MKKSIYGELGKILFTAAGGILCLVLGGAPLTPLGLAFGYIAGGSIEQTASILIKTNQTDMVSYSKNNEYLHNANKQIP